MTTQIQRRWGILALAVVMFLVTLIVTNINGAKTSVYYYVWMMVGYYAYKDRLPDIKTLMKIVIFLNIAVLALVAIFMDNDGINYVSKSGKTELIFGVLVMLVPKIFLYLYCDKQLKELATNQTSNDSSIANQKSVYTPPNTTINHISKVGTAKNSLLSTNESSKILNFQIANPSYSKVEIDEGTIWASVYQEFDSNERNVGLWAQLFSQNEGNESKAKAAYLKTRFDDKSEERRKATLALREAEKNFARKDYLNRTEEACLKDKVFDLYTSSTFEIFVFPNGKAAYKRFRVYKVYESKDAAINAVKIYLNTEVLGRSGFIREIHENEL